MKESLWQTPQACKRTGTSVRPGSGRSRSSMRKRPPGSGTIIARIFNMAGSAVGRTSYIGVEGVQTYSDPPPNVAYGWKPVIRSCRLIDASAPKHRSGLCDYEIG